MTGRERGSHWTAEVARHLPHLRTPRATVPAAWSPGMVVARSCAPTAVSSLRAARPGREANSVRPHLRELLDEAAATRGAKRRARAVRARFRPLRAWVPRGYDGPRPAPAPARDAPTLGDRFGVPAVSVVERGGACPVAWTVRRATAPHAWRAEWRARRRPLWRAVPPEWTAVVPADRGLYARWLYRRIGRLGRHPFLRINRGGTFRPDGRDASRPRRRCVPTVGGARAGGGTAVKGRPRALRCTLLARWEAGHADPRLILTDLPPEAAAAAWYGPRARIEQGCTLTTRAGWQRQRTRSQDPARAERRWLAVAVATPWLVRVGGEADATLAAGPLADRAPARAARHRQRRATRARRGGGGRRGWVLVLVALLTHTPLPQGAFVPAPRPTAPPLPARQPEAAAS